MSDFSGTDENLCVASHEIFTPLDEAVVELERRNKDTELSKKVAEFLNGDIPEHFDNGPIFYLSRHVASPNFESLRFIEIANQYPHIKPVIGQDVHDKFVSNNSMKRALAKMPIVKGVTHRNDEIIEFFTLVDFDKTQGKRFTDITTIFGLNFVHFHNELFNVIYPNTINITDEASWVDANHRGNLVEHYKRLLSLLLTKGVMLESYEAKDTQFINDVLIPAFQFIENEFGAKPLIANLVPDELKTNKNWDAYPSVLYQTVKRATVYNQLPAYKKYGLWGTHY